jgi:hypothetical protein
MSAIIWKTVLSLKLTILDKKSNMSTKTTTAKAKAASKVEQPVKASKSTAAPVVAAPVVAAPVVAPSTVAPPKQSPVKQASPKAAVPAVAPVEEQTTQKGVLKSYSKKIKTAVDDMTLLVYEIGKQGKIALDDGSTLTKRDIKNLKKGIYKLLDDLNVDFKNAKKKRTGSNKALMSPFFISSQLVDFFFGVELGPSYRLGANGEYEVENKKLQTVLPPKGDDGVCIVNQMILNGLFSIYYRTHQLPSTGGWIKGDGDLVKHLGASMKQLNLDPARFKYFDFSRIRKHFKVNKEEYDDAYKEYLNNPEVQQLLERATRSIHTTVACLKSKEKDRKKKELELKRASQPPKPKATRKKAAATTEPGTVTATA